MNNDFPLEHAFEEDTDVSVVSSDDHSLVQQKGQLWLFNRDGEGLTLSAEDIAQMLSDWFEEHF